MNVQFVVEGEPQGKGRPQFSIVRGHAHVRTPAKTVQYQELIKQEYQLQCGSVYFMQGSELMVDITAYYKIPKSASRKQREKMQNGEKRPSKKPDCDNVIKAVLDALNGVAYYDDVQVVEVTFHKWYGDNPRLEIDITDINGSASGETKG